MKFLVLHGNEDGFLLKTKEHYEMVDTETADTLFQAKCLIHKHVAIFGICPKSGIIKCLKIKT